MIDRFPLDEQHRRIAEEARQRITRLITGQALKDLVGRVDRKLANACNPPEEVMRLYPSNVEAPAAREEDLSLPRHDDTEAQ